MQPVQTPGKNRFIYTWKTNLVPCLATLEYALVNYAARADAR
jgi:hypothetical protein